MKNPARTLTWLLIGSLGVGACLLGMYRHERNAVTNAQQELAELKMRLESIGGELAAMKERFNQLQDGMDRSQINSNPVDAIRRLTQLEAQQSNTLAFLQNVSDTVRPAISPEKALLGQQQAIAELKTQVAAHDQKVVAVKSKLQDWFVSLKIPDEIATLDASAALKETGLVNYWPYFEAKKEFEEESDFARLLKKKARIEELDMAVETARFNGVAK